MATSGQIQTNTSFGYVRLSWSQSSQNVTNNTTTISYTLSIYRSSSISSSVAKSYSVKINGVTVASGTTSIGGSGTKTIKTGTTTIAHNSDGTKTFSYSFSQQIDITWSGSWIGTVTGSGSGTLNTIPRATTPSISPGNVTLGQTLTITLNRASSAFTHTLSYAFGGTSGIIASNVGTSYPWTVPLTLANQIPNATSGTGQITCKTYNGTTLIGTKTIAFTATVPTSVVPVINSVTVSETVTTPNIATKFGAYVQNKSRPKVVTAAAGAYGSTIKSYRIYIRDPPGNTLATYTAADVTINPIPISGTVKVAVSVTDSRGRIASTVKDITVLAYQNPVISAFSAYRCNADGVEDYEGQHVKFTLKLDISPVNNLNDKYYEIVYRQKGTTAWNAITSSTSVYSVNGTHLSGAVFNPDYAYDVRLNVYDFFGSSVAALDIPTAFTIMDFRSTGKGIAFGKVSEADRMEVALDVDLTGEFIQEARQTPDLQNGWVNYGAGYESATYWKDKCGKVHIAGMIKSGTTAAETVIFTLPVGYRPRAAEKFFCVSMNAICVIDVYSTGAVAIKTGANSGWISLSGISFRSA